MDPKPPSEFEKAGGDDLPLHVEFVEFLRYNKKWWLWPLVIMLALMGLLIMLSQTSLAPFIYTLF
ncbi:MAG: hypothetical protein KatS3mg108_1336 [Isosphaeraceae bacterium]|jgi:hypothetical protein|nr:MAG: hypothetical protein KatS3mg108_1336 [Isosphaeraceae bacterium]